MRINKLFTRLSIGTFFATAVTVAANPAQASDEYIDVQKWVTEDKEVNINFDEKVFEKNNGDKVKVRLNSNSNPFVKARNEIDKLWKDDYGFEMSSDRKKLWLYNSNCKPGQNCTGGDPDLATGKGEYNKKIKGVDHTIKYNTDRQGRTLIIQENQTGGPDDNIGGIISFDFTDDVGVLFNSIGLLDLDEHKLPEFQVKFFGDDNLTDWFKFDERNSNLSTTSSGNTETMKLENPKHITEMTRQRGTITNTKTNVTKATDENSFREYKFDFGDKRVAEFHVKLSGSGAISGFNYARQEKNLKWVKKKVPEPTSILGLAAISGLAASSLKRKRKPSNV